MSREDLYKPPKMSAKIGTNVIASGVALAILINLFTVIIGQRPIVRAAWQSAVILLVGLLCLAAFRSLHRRAATLKPERMPMVHVGMLLIFMGGFYGCMILSVTGSLLNAFLMNLYMMPLMIGVALIQSGWMRRSGDSLHCPACEYEFNFPNPDDAPNRCPECGSGWLGLLKKGRKHKSNRLIAWGVGVCLLTLLGGIASQPIFYLPSLAPRLPTPVLYSILYLAPRGGFQAWNELARRPLTDEWTQTMARRLLTERREANWSPPGDDWFVAGIAAGTISQPLVEQYYRESHRAELRAPSTVRAGERFNLALRVQHVVGGPNPFGIFFGGYALGDAERVGPEPKTIWAHDMSPKGLFERHVDIQQRTFTAPATPGPFKVRVTYWVVCVPSFMEPLVWGNGSVPIKPKDALWFERVDLERTITVTP